MPDGKHISIGNIKLEYDATNKALKITNTTTDEVANLYTSGGVSAYGVGTSTSTGGGLNGSVKSYSDALKLTSESLSEIASAYSVKALDSRISSLEGGSATAISVSGSGNAVTSVTKNGTTISVVKGSTFLTSHQSFTDLCATLYAGSGVPTDDTDFITSNDIGGFSYAGALNRPFKRKASLLWQYIKGKTDTIYQPKGSYITSHQDISGKADKSQLANYLPLSGGTMSGIIQLVTPSTGMTEPSSMRLFLSTNKYNGINSTPGIGFHIMNVCWGNLRMESDTSLSWFNYNNSGYYPIKAKGFIIGDNASDSYVLLGGGGHKEISSLSVNYATSSGSANSVAWSNVSGRPTKVSQFTNDSGYITSSASITGNAATATKLQTARNLWGNSFNGTNDIGGTILPSATHTYNLGSTTYMFERTYTRYIETDIGYDLRLVCAGNEILRLAAADKSVNINYDASILGTTRIANGLEVYRSTNHGCKVAITEFVASTNGGSINVIDTNGSSPNSRPLALQYGQGNVGIGTLTPSEKLEVYGNVLVNDSSNSAYRGLKIKANSRNLLFGVGTSTKIGVYSYSDSKWLFYTDTSTFYNSGNILATGGITAYSSSDIRLKQDLRKLDYFGIIKAMGGTFGFAWKKDNTRSIGWIAQNVLCNPHLKDIVETDEKGYYKINYWSPKLIATAFGAIEQVGDEVSRLKARVVFLESEVLRLSGDKEDCNKKRLDNKNINLLN